MLLIFVDDLHFEPEYSPNVRKLYSTLVDTLVHDGDLAAVVSSGPSSIEIQPTYDRKLVAAAVSKIRGSAMTPAEMFKTIETSQGPGDIRQRAQTAFYAAYNIVADLEKVQNKRKAILYISTGYDFDPFADARRGRDRIQGGRFSEPSRFYYDEENPFFRLPSVNADIELYRYMRELTLSANRANASIFTIDPRGLAGIVDAGQYLDQSEWRTYLQKIAELAALSRRNDGRLRHRQRQRLCDRVQAHRRGDERLLRARLLLVERRSHQARAAARRESRPSQRDRVRAPGILAEDTRDAGRAAEEEVR